MLQYIQLLHLVRIGEIRYEISLLVIEDELLIVRKDVVAEVGEQHQLLDDWEILHEILVLGEERLGPEEMDEDLCPSNLCPQEHGHELGLGRELEVRLFHFMLDDAAVDIIE
jgi:hypothetical protein